jgi:hypothetical protein
LRTLEVIKVLDKMNRDIFDTIHDLFFHSTNGIFFDILIPVLAVIGMILWVYCFWFHSKYDKDTNKLILLLVFNLYYLPFYLYRIKQLKRELQIKALSEEIFDSEFIEQSRLSILDVLRLWASSKSELELLQNENDINIVEEMFSQWNDFYRIDTKIIKEAFQESEMRILEAFDQSLLLAQEKYSGTYPDLAAFHETNDWQVLNQMANEIVNEIE